MLNTFSHRAPTRARAQGTYHFSTRPPPLPLCSLALTRAQGTSASDSHAHEQRAITTFSHAHAKLTRARAQGTYDFSKLYVYNVLILNTSQVRAVEYRSLRGETNLVKTFGFWLLSQLLTRSLLSLTDS